MTSTKNLLTEISNEVDKMEILIDNYISASNIYQVLGRTSSSQFNAQKMLGDFCSTISTLNSKLYELSKITDDLLTDDYMALTSYLTLLRYSPTSSVPELACIQDLCAVFADTLISLEIDPDVLVCHDTGDVLYDFKNDTPETFLQRYLDEIEEN